MNINSNVNDVVRAVLNSLIFFCEKILHTTKAQKYKDATEQKHQITNKQTKIKNELKKYLRGKKSLICLFALLCKIKNRKKRKVPTM